MPEIVIYTMDFCYACQNAKALLKEKGATFEEHELDRHDTKARAALAEKSGGRKTVPQIFIGGQHIGGWDDLNALDRQGKLDTLLNA